MSNEYKESALTITCSICGNKMGDEFYHTCKALEIDKLVKLDTPSQDESEKFNVSPNLKTYLNELPKDLMKRLECKLIHSRVPKMTENGIVLVCKEGCDTTHSLESDSSLLSS